jgi:hypothetical protein
MKRTVLMLAVAGAIGAAIATVPASAHHSFAATYFEDRTQTVEGDLAQFLFRNPHSFVQLEAKDAKTGETTRWAVEWAGGLQLGRQGVTRETLRAGDHVIITGNPGRNPADHRLRMRAIKRPSDNWSWSGDFE